MTVAYTDAAQSYRITRAVLRMDEFTVSELRDLSGAGETTIQAFLKKIEAAGSDFLTATDLVDEEVGATKRYSLTPAGSSYLRTYAFETAPQLEKTRSL